MRHVPALGATVRSADGRIVVERRGGTQAVGPGAALAATRDGRFIEIVGRRNPGARYERNLIKFTSRVVTDRELVTGQNPQSARALGVNEQHARLCDLGIGVSRTPFQQVIDLHT